MIQSDIMIGSFFGLYFNSRLMIFIIDIPANPHLTVYRGDYGL